MNMDKLKSLPALNGISCPWKTEGMDIPHHLSIAADLQCVLHKTIHHQCFPEQTNESFPEGKKIKQINT
jgi:hypothetical protein